MGITITVAVFIQFKVTIVKFAWLLYPWQAGDDLDNISKEKVFVEPQLTVLKDREGKYSQGFAVAEQEVLFEVANQIHDHYHR